MDSGSGSPEQECRGLLISSLHDDFWSDEYYRAAQVVRGWRDKYGSDFPSELFGRLERAEHLSDEELREVTEANAGRRPIKSCFRKTQQLCARGFLTEDDLREHLTMPPRLETLFEIIEPFEVARKLDYNREMFDFYDALHVGELERPAR